MQILGLSAGRERYLQGLYDLLCLFGKLTQEECLHMSVHNSTVNALKVHLPSHVEHSVPFWKNKYLDGSTI